MRDAARWSIVIALALVLIGLIAYARGPEHHHGDEVGAHGRSSSSAEADDRRSRAPQARRRRAWHGLDRRRDVRAARGRPAVRSRRRRGRAAAGRAYGPEQARRGEEGAGLAGVPPPVPRPDAARPGRRRDRQHRRAPGVRTGIVIIGLTVLNAVLGLNQEGKAAESVAALQKMLLIKAHARRGGERVDIPAEEVVPGRHRHVRGRRQGPRRRAAARRRDARDRGGGADRREHAGAEVGRPGARRRRPARRPHRHGLHELDRDARPRRDGGHGDGNDDRGRADLRDARAGSSRRRRRSRASSTS